MDKVLVVVGYTDYKYVTRPLYPGAFLRLDYENKELLFVDEKIFPEILTFPTGDRIAAEVRAFGIKKAIEKKVDWVLFLDVDFLPDPDMLKKMLSLHRPLVGAAVASRGNSADVIAHTYKSYETLEREKIIVAEPFGIKEVGGVAAAAMLVHKDIFTKVDYTGYKGIYHYPGRTTCDDEYFCLEVYKKLKIKPVLDFNSRGYHFNDDGFAYRYPNVKAKYKRTRDVIIFKGKGYCANE
jgi:hypothetical protein